MADAELLQAEIERLRAEVERLRADLMESDEIREKLGHLLTRTAAALKGEPPAGVWHSWHDLPEKAAQLVEALALLPDEIVMIEHNPYEGPLMFCCGQRVTLSWRHGLEPTHNKGCWYARMRALRDHDKENSND